LDDKKDCLIVDPYMGSGTSAVVCKLLGHNYFGIDISEEYITNANNRVNNITEKEITDFNTEIQKHKVNKTYKERKLEKGK
jgi:DNA modification methylase